MKFMTTTFRWPVLVPLSALAVVLSLFIIFSALATSKDDIVFPVAELEGCESEVFCRAYCDNPDNFSSCFAFARQHNLLEGPIAGGTPEQIDKFAQAMLTEGGPGGCRTHQACEAYCNNANNMVECINWSERHGVMSGQELEEAKKVVVYLQQGGKLPGGCSTRQSCENYCSTPSHVQECLDFAVQAGFIPPEEVEQAKKFMEFMQRGETPGGCRTKEQCEQYCFDENNTEECMSFAEKAGLASPQELEMFRKTGGRGPGGCRGQVQCEEYCAQNQEECFSWAKENGLMSEEDIRHMEEGASKLIDSFDQMPPEMAQCVKNILGEEGLSKLKEGGFAMRDLGDKMRVCFEGVVPGPSPGGPYPGGFEGQPGPGQYPAFQGPGGCKTPEECQAYCSSNPLDPACGGHGANQQPLQQQQYQPPSGEYPTSGEQPTPEQLQQYQEQYKQQYEQQYQQQYQQQYPTPEQYQQYPQYQPPQSTRPAGLAGSLLSFLANVLTALRR